MDNIILIILGIILIVLIMLNHITVIQTTETQTTCAQTAFGCCPDGINSKINYYGTNCPGYRPGYGPNYGHSTLYYPTTNPPPPGPGPTPPKPIGGCAGTRYGCCPNNKTTKIDSQGSNCLLK